MHYPSRFFCAPAGSCGKRALLVCGIFFLLGFAGTLHGQVRFDPTVVQFFSSTGCTGCHGTAGGLTLTGTVDQIYNAVSTRVNLGSPSNSLILTKPSAGPPSTSHSGGKFPTWATNQTAYTTTLEWIQEGALRNPRTLFRSPSTMTFNATAGGANPPSQTLQIRNTGNGAMNWTVSDNQTWLSLSPTSGSATTETDNITVSVNITNLAANTYTATITITGTDAVSSPQTTTVTLNLAPPAPTISRTPSAMTFSATVGGSNPANQTLQISNSGGGTLNWSVSTSSNPFGLSLSPASGSSTGETDNVTVSVNIAGLAAGSYPGTITISAPGATNTPQTTAVTLNVTAPTTPIISRSPASMNFFATVGGANPANQTLAISNSGGGSLNWSVSDNQPWLSLSPTSGSSTGETDNVTVSVSIAGLAVGNYTGTITISAPGATNTPQTTAVNLSVTSGVDFFDDFSDGNANGWQPLTPSRWSVLPNTGNPGFAYCLATANPDGDDYSLLATRSWTDFVLEVDAKVTSTASNRNFFIDFCAGSPTNYIPSYYLQFRVNEVNLYRDTTITVRRDFVSDNLFHRIRVERRFPNIKVFVDGGFLFEVNDRALSGGYIGFGSFKSTACFDNVAITSTALNPAPTLTSLNPASGNRLQTLNVVFNGTNFISGVTSVNVGADITVNAINVTSATSLTANLTIGANAATGSRNFSVSNSGPGGGTSGNQTFTVNNPTPTLAGLAPNVGNRLQNLNVVFTGTNFISGVTSVNVGADITVNAINVTSATSLTANLTIGANAATGPRNFSVSNSGPGGGTSGNQTFTVNNPAPALTSLSPNAAARLQTLDVVFTGSNFISGVTTVNVGANITVNSFTVTSATSLRANLTISASAATGGRNFSVTNTGPGGGASGNLTFNVNNPEPALTNIAPALGNRLQTLNVVFTGSNFISGATSVDVGSDITVNSTTVTSATSLTANLTINASAVTGPRNFSVINSSPGGGTSNDLSFTINDPAPTLNSIAPATGNRLQTLDVVFTGTNFINGVSSVNVGEDITINSTTVTSATSLTANLTIGAGAATGSRNFSVTNTGSGGGTSGNVAFTVNNPIPVLSNLSPATGNRLQTLDVVFTGANFINGVTTVNAGAGITVNSITVTNATSLTASLTIDASAATGPRNFSVTNSAPGGGASGNVTFTVNNPGPTLSSIAPNMGNRLQTLDVLFTGADFINGVTTVNVGSGITVNATNVTNSTSLTANLTISANAATGPRNFSVTNSGATSASQTFTVNNPAPALISIAPASGNLGQTLDVVFTGVNFMSGVTTVNAGADIAVNSITVTSATSLTANLTIAANAATGPRNFSVTNSSPGGGTSGNQTFSVNTPAPTLIGIAPANGNRLQTLDVVFTGTNFINSGTTVEVGSGITVNSVTVTSATTLTANLTITANAATGPQNFAVTNTGPGGGTSASQTFTVNNPAPTLTSIAPASGNAGQTLNVIFTGANFINGVTAVNAGAGITINSTTVTSATNLTANLRIAPNAATGSRDFTVANSGPGGGASMAQIFTVTAIQTDRVIRAVNTFASPGGTADVAVELVSQGDENALGFSLVFDPATLSNPQARLGRDATSASLNVNTSQQSQGRLGILLSLTTGQRFSAGARELVVVNFAVTPSTAAVSTPVDFGDQPISREVSDVNATSLPVNWTAGTITFTRGFEADVSPRPTGNNNGTVTIADWVQLGRFSAGLETPRTDVNEFQRADCAPKPCGDGRVGVSDWVQAGLYAAGLEPVVAACGAVSSSLHLAPGEMSHTAVSAVRMVHAVFTRGRMDTLLVEIETPDAVNAVGFGLTFDATVLAFEKVLPGNGARGATLHVNSSQKANGQIGIALALAAGQSFASGGCQLVQVIFTVLPSSAKSSTHIAFTSQPIAQEVVSTAAMMLQTTWNSAMITLQNSTSVESSAEGVPVAFELGQNYPNPFNPSTMIHFALPQATHVSLKIFSVLGEEIAVLVDQELAAGRYDVRWEAQDAKSGVYLYRLQAGSWSQTKKLMFMR